MASQNGDQSVDRFREEFKRYKRNKPPPDYSDVIEFSRDEQHSQNKVTVRDLPTPSRGVAQKATALGLNSPDNWRVYGVSDIPGLVVVPNPFVTGAQHYWINRCLVDYPCHPNVCNLDAHMNREGRGQIWSPGNDSTIKKLTWVTLGYHYNWTTKEYSPSNHSEFPADLSGLSSFVLHCLGFDQFKAEAAIVNYYQTGATLSGHTDHSEQNLTAPLLSISFSQSAVFLIGGQTKDIKPTALYVHSGDVIVMSQQSRLAYHGVPKILTPGHPSVPDCLTEAALRQRIQQVKKLQSCLVEMEKCTTIKTSGSSASCVQERISGFHFTDILKFDYQWLLSNWKHFETYLNTTRINMNIRQVYH